MKKVLIKFLVASSVFICSCKKETTNPTDNNSIVLTISSPAESVSFNRNETVRISGTATNTVSMHGYQVVIHPVGDTTAVFRAVNHTHSTNLEIQEQWINSVTTVTNMVAEVTVYIDHEGHTNLKTRQFTCR